MEDKQVKEYEMVENRAEEYFLSDLLFNNDNQIVLLIKPRKYDTMLNELQQKE